MRHDVDYGAAFPSTVEHYLASLVARRDFAQAVSYFETHRQAVE
jgi:hypothetical protein